ncbi:helix-turn-helix domain-containing protein [Sphingomicrobium sp. XHP0235]|uniref:helix-turn-helix domain-containing protein n=1 Tax=Sphingomicrobium aquimarinum TaxID=3133971 RepID=UPI0031FEBDDF
MSDLAIIQRVVADHYEIDLRHLLSDRRTRAFAYPRQVAMALAAELTGYSLPRIGRAFDRDHTTVMHAQRRLKALGDDLSIVRAKVEAELAFHGYARLKRAQDAGIEMDELKVARAHRRFVQAYEEWAA